jgi:DNA-binding GntR family transcriptional regulator
MAEDPRLYMRTAKVIEDRIASGEYEHGQRLNIGLIADELGVSRRTVGTAMNVLATRELVRFWQGLGWHVT